MLPTMLGNLSLEKNREFVMIISMIVAVDKKFGIGKGNQLLCHLPNDLKRFKAITMGKPIIMGRKTYQSIGKPLPGRRNIVISRTQPQIKGVDVFSSIDEALNSCLENEEVMIIGGATLYQQLIDRADKLFITHIHATFDADTFFPTVNHDQWQVIDSQYIDADEKNPYSFELKTYRRQAIVQ